MTKEMKKHEVEQNKKGKSKLPLPIVFAYFSVMIVLSVCLIFD